MAQEFEETVTVVKVDVDDLEEVASDAEVKAMPTFHLYVDGKKSKEVVGASKEKLRDLFT